MLGEFNNATGTERAKTNGIYNSNTEQQISLKAPLVAINAGIWLI